MRKFIEAKGVMLNGALFVSGSGSNAEKVLAYELSGAERRWNPALLVTDAPGKSRAGEIASAFGLPLVALDIREFYRERGESRVSLATEKGREVREEWTCELRRLVQPYGIAFGILAGFVPLTNITGDFPCLNVHPGDLTVEADGRRILVGLHTVPVEKAILGGFSSMRSSVIIAQPYTGSGGEMDSGPILGVSGEVEIDLGGHELCELEAIASARPGARPPGGYKDLLEEIAAVNQTTLKEKGDWIVLPRVVRDFAGGRFALGDGDILNYCTGGKWIGVKTVEYRASGEGVPVKSGDPIE